jgi:hypothetical protein
MAERLELRERRPYEHCHTDRHFVEWLRAQGLLTDEGPTSPTPASRGRERIS